ncbi:MAG TPA: EAL domain-containing protein [Solirubrobacteraceae bacterium]
MATLDSTVAVLEKRTPGRGTFVVALLALASAAVVALATTATADWNLSSLLVIAAFTTLSGIAYVDAGSSRLSISGTMLGLVLAGALLGGGPAALIGLVTTCVRWARSRESFPAFVDNLVTFTWFPLIAGLLFRSAVSALGLGHHDIGYYVLIFPAFFVALLLNFVGVVGFQCYLDRTSLWRQARDLVPPVLAAEMLSALLTMAAVYLTWQTGTLGLALLGLILVTYQYLVGELLRSKQRASELQRIATTDELTGLANRERFRQRVEGQIADAGPRGTTFAVMLIDLDRFKEVNDTLGHHYGDELLRGLGPRLVASAGDDAVVARLGGDEFAVLPDASADDVGELERIAERLIECVQEPVLMEGMTLQVGASVGIARFPVDGDDAHTLLRRSDVAMYAAKESHSGCKLYAAELDHHSLRRLSVLSDFRRALNTDEIVVHYQPIVDVEGTSVRGAEGLVRWEHPDLGMIPPGEFIQTVEQSGLIGPLTRHVLERSIMQCAEWRRAGHDLSVAVNLSVRDLLDRSLPGDIEHMLTSYHVPAAALQLEITESMLMSDPERSLATLMRLNELGLCLSVDDFGTGYSSLANLRRMPINELKIDRSFVSPMLQDESDLIIVRSTINLGHDLGLRVIAEGVEDEPTLAHLAHLGCDLAQGYHVSRPLPAEAFSAWMGTAGAQPALPVAV